MSLSDELRERLVRLHEGLRIRCVYSQWPALKGMVPRMIERIDEETARPEPGEPEAVPTPNGGAVSGNLAEDNEALRGLLRRARKWVPAKDSPVAKDDPKIGPLRDDIRAALVKT